MKIDGLDVEVQPFKHDEERASPPESPLARPSSPHGFTRPSGLAGAILCWSPRIFMVAYFIFSVSIYTMLPTEGTKVFWFLYLTIGTCLASVTVLEAFDGLSLLKLARKTIANSARSGWTDDAKLPHVELIKEESSRGGYEDEHALRATLDYPADKLRITLLPIEASDTALLNHLCYNQDRQTGELPEITVLLNHNQRPHPHAIRRAVGRLTANENVDLIQSRSVLTWPCNSSFLTVAWSSLASLQHDASHGLILPGRTVTWETPVSCGIPVYSRTSALQNAMRSVGCATTRKNGVALAFAAMAQNAKAVYDMSVITYTLCPGTLVDGICFQLHEAAQWAASVNHLSLAFAKSKTNATSSEKSRSTRGKFTFKQRMCILYTLLLQRLGAHAILQYFCLALAMTITHPPNSVSEFSTLIFFPYHISIWLIVSGLLCLVGTVAMVHHSASEYAPPGWTFPVLVLLYPFMLLGQAGMDVYAQVGVMLGSF